MPVPWSATSATRPIPCAQGAARLLLLVPATATTMATTTIVTAVMAAARPTPTRASIEQGATAMTRTMPLNKTRATTVSISCADDGADATCRARDDDDMTRLSPTTARLWVPVAWRIQDPRRRQGLSSRRPPPIHSPRRRLLPSLTGTLFASRFRASPTMPFTGTVGPCPTRSLAPLSFRLWVGIARGHRRPVGTFRRCERRSLISRKTRRLPGPTRPTLTGHPYCSRLRPPERLHGAQM